MEMEPKDYLDAIFDNMGALIANGTYESTLILAYPYCPTGNYDSDFLFYLFSMGNRAKLWAAGDEPPDSDRYTIYRGISGTGSPRGLSWTLSLCQACWFAARGENSVVCMAHIRKADVFCYLNSRRNEREFVCRPVTSNRLDLSIAEIVGLAESKLYLLMESGLDYDDADDYRDEFYTEGRDSRRVRIFKHEAPPGHFARTYRAIPSPARI